MQALNHSVLKETLSVQEAIIGEQAGCICAFSNETTGRTLNNQALAFHSPLLFWNCSYELIDQDNDLVTTINKKSDVKSPFGFTLRPTSVFAMKTFEKKRFIAADTLVITLFDHSGSSSRHEWDTRFSNLAAFAPSRWSIYPEDPHTLHRELYQFQYKPISSRDDFILFLAYAAMITYVLISVRKLRAFKSKFGLIVAVFVEIGVSILASFSICGAMKIDLAMMPQEAFPFVVLVIGLENM